MPIVNMLSGRAGEVKLPQRTKSQVHVEVMNLLREGPYTRARFLAKKRRGRSRGVGRAKKRVRKWADKPGSVVERPFILYLRCHRPLLGQPERGPGRPIALLFALSPDGACQAAPLPTRWCALTAPFQLFSPGPEGRRRESSFLWRYPSGRPARPLAGILPCGARTFLTGRLHKAPAQRGRLAHFRKEAS